jgi:maleylacetate reductase
VLPHAVRYNADAAREAMRRIGAALGVSDPAVGLYDLEKRLNLPLKLADIGMQEADIERAAKIAADAPYPNPRKVEYEPVRKLLRDAYEGRRPARPVFVE